MDGSVETLQGWRLLRGCALPGPLPCALVLVALHPKHGIALVDPLPQLTPDAADRLRQRLRQARFGAVYGEAWPPAQHLALHAEEMSRLPQVLAEAFRGRPAPELPGGDAWMDTVARALAPELPLTSAPSPSAGRLRPKQRQARRWRLALGLGAAAMLAVGLGWAAWPRPHPSRIAAPAPAAAPAARNPNAAPTAANPNAAPAAPSPAAAPAATPRTERLSLEAPPTLPMPAPAAPRAETADEPVPEAAPLPAAPLAEFATLAPPAGPLPNPSFSEAAPNRPRPQAPAATPVLARNARRCQALVQRIQTGEEASEDELLRLQACGPGG